MIYILIFEIKYININELKDSSVTYIKVFLFIIVIIHSTSYTKIKSPMMVMNDTYEFKIYEHPKCNMKLCSKVIGNYTYNCGNDLRIQSVWNRWTAVIYMYTSSATKFVKRLSQGSPGLYWCFMDLFLSWFLKIWNYNGFLNIPKIEILYIGINKERSRNHGLVDRKNVYSRNGILSLSHHSDQLLLNIVWLIILLINILEEVLYLITTLKYK